MSEETCNCCGKYPVTKTMESHPEHGAIEVSHCTWDKCETSLYQEPSLPDITGRARLLRLIKYQQGQGLQSLKTWGGASGTIQFFSKDGTPADPRHILAGIPDELVSDMCKCLDPLFLANCKPWTDTATESTEDEPIEEECLGPFLELPNG